VKRWVLGLGLATACDGQARVEDERLEPDPVGDQGQADDRDRASRGDRAGEHGSLEPGPSTSLDAGGNEAPAEPAAEPRAASLELVFVGDMVLGEYLRDSHRSFAGPLAPGDPFADVAELLRADLVVGNLESPVMHEIPEHSPLRHGHRFGASAPAVAALAHAGFSVMSVANNHANDLARDGLLQTPEVLRAAGITPVGGAVREGSPLRIETLEHRGWRIGLLSATTWLNNAPAPGDPALPVVATRDLERMLVPLVEQARPEHDLVIVLLHWGRERRERPEPAQLHAAHALIDAGADLVIGHHPHVLQGVERHGDGLVAYSLGNFLFPAREEAFRDSAILRVSVTAEPRRVARASLHPVRLGPSPGHDPRLATPKARKPIHERLVQLSSALGSRWRRDGEHLVSTLRADAER
jgi:poly-gamma-glutamate capsule biosynthesis protein CapA/YwtB (metallophosphatase superfamily)